MDNTLRKLQLTQLRILNVIDSFCRTYSIQYSLYAGTLLGAVRHKGFIPWDDDLDICMTRENYDKFIEKWDEHKPDGYLLQNKEIEPAFSQCFSKVRKEHTTFLQAVDPINQYHVGIFIDIFPADRLPNGKMHRMLYRNICKVYLLYTKSYIPKDANFFERLIVRCLFRLVPKSKQEKLRGRLSIWLQRYNELKGNEYVLIESNTSIHRALPSDLFDEYVDLRFEDKDYMCVKQWDVFLKMLYGDYMKLPPEDQRIGIHNAQIIDFDNDYSEHIAKEQHETIK